MPDSDCPPDSHQRLPPQGEYQLLRDIIARAQAALASAAIALFVASFMVFAIMDPYLSPGSTERQVLRSTTLALILISLDLIVISISHRSNDPSKRLLMYLISGCWLCACVIWLAEIWIL